MLFNISNSFLYAKSCLFCAEASNYNPLKPDLLTLFRRPNPIKIWPTYAVPPTTTLYPRSTYDLWRAGSSPTIFQPVEKLIPLTTTSQSGPDQSPLYFRPTYALPDQGPLIADPSIFPERAGVDRLPGVNGPLVEVSFHITIGGDREGFMLDMATSIYHIPGEWKSRDPHWETTSYSSLWKGRNIPWLLVTTWWYHEASISCNTGKPVHRQTSVQRRGCHEASAPCNTWKPVHRQTSVQRRGCHEASAPCNTWKPVHRQTSVRRRGCNTWKPVHRQTSVQRRGCNTWKPVHGQTSVQRRGCNTWKPVHRQTSVRRRGCNTWKPVHRQTSVQRRGCNTWKPVHGQTSVQRRGCNTWKPVHGQTSVQRRGCNTWKPVHRQTSVRRRGCNTWKSVHRQTSVRRRGWHLQKPVHRQTSVRRRGLHLQKSGSQRLTNKMQKWHHLKVLIVICCSVVDC